MFVLNTAVEILLLLVQFLHDFDLILFADLHSWSTETTFARRSYLAFAHFLPCRGLEERLIFIWELFEFGSHDGMCVLDIENNDQLQDLELHSQRKLPKSQTRFCHKLVRLFIHQMTDFLDENWPHPEIFPNCDSKGYFCYDNKLLVKINDVFQNLISSTLFFSKLALICWKALVKKDDPWSR